MMELTIMLGFAVIALSAVAVVMTRRARAAEQQEALLRSAYKDVREAAQTSYSTGYGHGLDEGYRKAELHRANEQAKRIAQEWDAGGYSLN